MMAANEREWTQIRSRMDESATARDGEPLTNTDKAALHELCDQVIGAVYEVANTLGPGFLEKVYEHALIRELSLRGVGAESQVAVPVNYKGAAIGVYFADILVEGRLIVELKCVERFSDEHVAQCINYLKATGLRRCLLVNFQNAKVRWQRIVYNF
jgi:GxxExxY protein